MLGASSSINVTLAYFTQGEHLHKTCTTDPFSALRYVLGVVDAHEWDYIANDMPNSKICIPDEANGAQIRDTVCKYISDNPHVRHLPAVRLTFNSLESAFPCGGNTNRDLP
ncbi:Rap1a/Tai family immunity protein [Microvirga arabica]